MTGAILALAMAAVHLIPAGLGWKPGSRDELYAAARTAMNVSGTRFFFTLLSFCVLAPAGEELLFRRIIYTTLRKKMSFLRALFISSVFFAVTHGAAAPLVFPASLLLGYVYEKKRRLPVNIMLHALINLFALCVRLS